MEQPSRSDTPRTSSLSTHSLESGFGVFESQIRECYGRVVWTHKTHEKKADRCQRWLAKVKITQIILSAIVTGGLLTTVFGESKEGAILGAVCSTLLLALNLYMKNVDLGAHAEAHKSTAVKLWNIRESYLSLLTDIRSDNFDLGLAQQRRNKLQKELGQIYDNAPRTDKASYAEAGKALNALDEMTFSDEEIDKYLPEKLRRATQ